MKLSMRMQGIACYLLDKPEDHELFSAVQNTCYTDKVVNPGVDDEGAADTLRQARNDKNFWKKRFIEPGRVSFVVLEPQGKRGYNIVGATTVLLPSNINDLKSPLMCNAHVLDEYRGRGLSELLTNASIDYIANNTNYCDVHVQALNENEPSKGAIAKKGFMVLKRGEKYITYMGRIGMLKKRLPAQSLQ